VTSTLKSSIYRWSFHEINHPVFSEEKTYSDFGTQEKQKTTNENIESKQKQKTKATFRACLKEKTTKQK